MPPKTKTAKRSTTPKAGPAAAAPVVRRFVPSPNVRCMLDEIAEMLLFVLNAPGQFVYRVVKRGSPNHGCELAYDAATRADADKKAAKAEQLINARLRFVREVPPQGDV